MQCPSCRARVGEGGRRRGGDRHHAGGRRMVRALEAPLYTLSPRPDSDQRGGGGTEVGGGKRGARRIDSSISGVTCFICSVTRAASTAVPITRGVMSSSSSVFSITSWVEPKRYPSN